MAPGGRGPVRAGGGGDPVRAWAFFAGVLLLYALETSLVVPLWGVRADLVFVLVCITALHVGWWEGAVAGFAAGLLVDVADGHLIGLGAAAKGLAGAAVGWVGRSLFESHALVPALVILCASALEQSFYVLGTLAFGLHLPLGEAVVRVILPSTWYDAIVGVILYPVLAPVVRRVLAAGQPDAGAGPVEGHGGYK